MSTACSYNSAIGIKYISYWFMSCLFLVFPSVWVYTVSPGVLLCSLAERMNGLPPPLPFIWLFEGCGCHWALQPLGVLSHPAFSPGQTGRWDRNEHLPAVFEGVSGLAGTPWTFPWAPGRCFSFCSQNLGPVLVLQVGTVGARGAFPKLLPLLLGD